MIDADTEDTDSEPLLDVESQVYHFFMSLDVELSNRDIRRAIAFFNSLLNSAYV